MATVSIVRALNSELDAKTVVSEFKIDVSEIIQKTPLNDLHPQCYIIREAEFKKLSDSGYACLLQICRSRIGKNQVFFQMIVARGRYIKSVNSYSYRNINNSDEFIFHCSFYMECEPRVIKVESQGIHEKFRQKGVMKFVFMNLLNQIGNQFGDFTVLSVCEHIGTARLYLDRDSICLLPTDSTGKFTVGRRLRVEVPLSLLLKIHSSILDEKSRLIPPENSQVESTGLTETSATIIKTKAETKAEAKAEDKAIAKAEAKKTEDKFLITTFLLLNRLDNCRGIYPTSVSIRLAFADNNSAQAFRNILLAASRAFVEDKIVILEARDVLICDENNVKVFMELVEGLVKHSPKIEILDKNPIISQNLADCGIDRYLVHVSAYETQYSFLSDENAEVFVSLAKSYFPNIVILAQDNIVRIPTRQHEELLKEVNQSISEVKQANIG